MTWGGTSARERWGGYVHCSPFILAPPPAPHTHIDCPPSQDRRKELAKSVAKFGEDGKVALRNVRKDIMKKV